MSAFIIIYLRRRSHIGTVLEFFADHQEEWNRLDIQVKILYDFDLPEELMESVIPFQRVKRILTKDDKDFTALYSFVFETTRRVFYIGSEGIREFSKKLQTSEGFLWKRFLSQSVPAKQNEPTLMFLIRPSRSQFQKMIRTISETDSDVDSLLDKEMSWNSLVLVKAGAEEEESVLGSCHQSQFRIKSPSINRTNLFAHDGLKTLCDSSIQTAVPGKESRDFSIQTDDVDLHKQGGINEPLKNSVDERVPPLPKEPKVPQCVNINYPLSPKYNSIEEWNQQNVSLVYMKVADPDDPKNRWRSPIPRGNSHPFTYCRKYWDHILSHPKLWNSLMDLSGVELGDTVPPEDSIGQVLIGLFQYQLTGKRREDLVFSFDEWVAGYPSHYFGQNHLPAKLAKKK